MNDYQSKLEQDACERECDNYLSNSPNNFNDLIAKAFIDGWKSHSNWFEKTFFDDGK